MPAHWERELGYHQAMRRMQGPPTYQLVRRWRRRAIAAWILNVLQAVALVVALSLLAAMYRM